MIVYDAKEYWEACQDYYETGYTILLNCLYVSEENEIIRGRVEHILDSIDKEKNSESH